MTPTEPEPLSRRERQILDIVYARREATAGEIRDDMPDAPSYSAVRGLLRVLVEKGHLRARKEGVRNAYRPTRSRGVAGRKALARALETFYDGDLGDAVAALLRVSGGGISNEERARLLALIDDAQREGR
ncbi:MAG: BlaI/MecI/CopY family transcriptional regulator [Planctomycetota bacterium]